MDFNEHYKIRGSHAFLSASNYHWVNYTDDKLVERYFNHQAAAQGVALHAYADMAIKLRQRQPETGNTLNKYINDAIGFRMHTEQVLFYSENAFGTADTISFRDKFLRIHDLKTGVTPANMLQPMVYAAFFCLEYEYDPREIEIELRIYQGDEVALLNPEAEDIRAIMEQTKNFDRIIREMKEVSE